jgi:hypothetical protein
MPANLYRRTDSGTEAFYPATTAERVDTGGGTLAQALEQMDAKVNGKAAVHHYTAVLPAAGWTAAAPYTQTVAVPGMLATDTPLVDVTLSAAPATALAELAAYGHIGRIDTVAGQITATCYKKKPAVNLTLAAKVVR